MSKFKPVSATCDFPALEREILDFWYKEGIVEKYLKRNESSDKKFSFLDGPITANNPMGVHHAWGRTYKDLWQRFFNMQGYKQRFQNGFDEQGLWVEVEVEKELGLKNKKEIENLVKGDKFKSLEKFINLCKERVKKYSAIQTEQSKRLGYFMDWNNSYHTSSDENNYAIWNFLKVVHEKGWLYKGRDSVPWCPRCGTAISQHEILTEEYKEIVHTSIFFKLPVKDKEGTYLLVWTTTPWTIPANVAVAVDPDLDYVKLRYWQLADDKAIDYKDTTYIVSKAVAEGSIKKENTIFPELREDDILESFKGKDLIDWEYSGPFDDLPAVKKTFGEYQHKVIASDPVILPIFTEEGSGLVHIAPGAGAEDYALGKKENLPVVAPIDEAAVFVESFDFLTGTSVNEVAPKIVEYLEKNGFLFKTKDYTHRYPICWRCKTELVWRMVDEWYIAMDREDDTGRTYRQQMIEVAKKINWIPNWGLERELDWLRNMHDWLISKKRYWGLALPVWECQDCGNFEVIGSKEELKEKTVEGWEDFASYSPHRPWVDQIKIKCSKCGQLTSRIPDVSNPWLDAGIVPFSTMPEGWFPADFVTEAFPGQFKNWFYSMIAMSTALKRTNPFKNLLGHALVVDEKGEEMHKSKGNAIEFNEAAEEIGVDVMRWLFVTQNPEYNLPFGFGPANEVRRRFYLILWNSYKFFVDYATLASWENDSKRGERNVLDRWILAGLNQLVLLVNDRLSHFDAATASRAIEDFIVGDFSTWYIRRSRDRVGPEANEQKRNTVLSLMHEVLATATKLLAPFMPFLSEEMHKNLTGGTSVHLTDYPVGDKSLLNDELIADMRLVRKIAEVGHAKRKEAGIKLRQPLASVLYKLPEKMSEELEEILAEELNVKKVEYQKSSTTEPKVELDTKLTQELKEEGEARDLIRQIQQLRKEQGLTLVDKTKVIAPVWPRSFESQILKSTASVSIEKGAEFKILKV